MVERRTPEREVGGGGGGGGGGGFDTQVAVLCP